jgi:hypothetical protein
MLVYLINKFYMQTSSDCMVKIRKAYLYDIKNCRNIIRDISKVLHEMETNKNLTWKQYNRYRLYNFILGEVRMFINRENHKNNISVYDLPNWEK